MIYIYFRHVCVGRFQLLWMVLPASKSLIIGSGKNAGMISIRLGHCGGEILGACDKRKPCHREIQGFRRQNCKFRYIAKLTQRM